MLGQLLKYTPGTIALGGHRGCGENLLHLAGSTGRVLPAYKENTIRSFREAVALGCNFIEFDVQVTADNVPVIFHDDHVVAQTIDGLTLSTEVRDLTLTQFQSLVAVPGAGAAGSLLRRFRDTHTRTHMSEFVPWLCDQDDFKPTLAQVFEALPESVGFNIEVKMSVPHTIAVTPAEEVDRMVLPILACVDACTRDSGRTVLFSSFDPDVCVRIAQLQNKFPVFFLSGCGIYPHADSKRTSSEAAIQFASNNKIPGIVVPASVLLQQEHMVAQARSAGLVVMTYGLDNNTLEAIQKQKDLGVHAAIVDDVFAVHAAMRELVV